MSEDRIVLTSGEAAELWEWTRRSYVTPKKAHLHRLISRLDLWADRHGLTEGARILRGASPDIGPDVPGGGAE